MPAVPQRQQLNWSHFKSEYAGKPDEDAEVHLLRMNDWMDILEFLDHIKVQRFYLTFVGEARLWYESLRPININWDGLQNMFRQQYSKIWNTREQLFHAWRFFNLDENTETIDTYIYHIRQVVTLLWYQEPQILEGFKNTLPTKSYWVLFPTMDLRQVVETAKRILTKEKIDRQLAGQTSSTPFMNVRDGHNKRVTFDITDDIEQKIDKLMTMMGKLVTEDKGQSKPFKPQVYQSNRCRRQNRGSYQDRFRSNNAYRGCSVYSQNFRGRMRYNFNNRGSYGYNTWGNLRYGRNNSNYRRNDYRNRVYNRNRSRTLERQDRSRRNDRSVSNSRLQSGSITSTNRDRTRCFECREYDHFARVCPTRKESRETEQIQQMFNMDEDQTI